MPNATARGRIRPPRPEMQAQVAVLIVCTGNICRSPTAEGVLRAMAASRGFAGWLQVDSAGTHDYHVGEAPDPRAIRHASARGYDLSGLRARRISAADFGAFDHVLAMDRSHLAILRAVAPAASRSRVGLFLEASRSWRDEDVPDPYYGGAAAFERVLDMVEEASGLWLERLARERAGANSDEPTDRPRRSR